MTSGSIDEIDHTSSANTDDMDTSDVTGTPGTQKIYEKEARIKVDYSDLSDDLKEVCLLFFM